MLGAGQKRKVIVQLKGPLNQFDNCDLIILESVEMEVCQHVSVELCGRILCRNKEHKVEVAGQNATMGNSAR